MTPPPAAPLVVEELLEHAGWVRELARRFAGDGAGADDLAQRAMLTALERRPAAGGRGLRPWLASVVARLHRHERRGEARRRAREQSAARHEGSSSDALFLLEELEQQQRLARAVEALPEPYRSVVWLRYYRGQGSAEIALARGLPAATVRSQLARGIERLKRELGQASPERPALLPLLGSVLRGGNPIPTGALLMKTSTQLAAVTVLLLGGLIGWQALRQPSHAGEEEQTAAIGGPVVPEAAGADDAGGDGAAPSVERSVDPRRESVAASAAGAASEGRAQSPSLTRLALRAVDEQGRPLAGAALAIVRRDGGPSGHAASTASGGDGRVQLELPDRALRVWRGEVLGMRFALTAPGQATRFLEATPARSETTGMGDVMLSPGGCLSGVVVDEDGRAVEGARVVGGPGALSMELEAARSNGPLADVCHPMTTSAADGSFRLCGLPIEKRRLWAQARGYGWTVADPVWVESGRERGGLELVLAPAGPGASFEGVVLDSAGAPCAGAWVHYEDGRAAAEGRLMTDAQGGFGELASPAASRRLRAVDPSGRFGPSDEHVWRFGDPPLELRLSRLRELWAVVRDEAGAPIEGAYAIAKIGERTFPGSEFSRADPEGRVRVVAPTERFGVSFTAEGFAGFSTVLFDPLALPAELDVVLERLPAVRGVVIADGRPLPGVRVELSQLPPSGFVPIELGFAQRLWRGNLRVQETDASGRFEIGVGLENEELVLVVAADGWATNELQVSLTEALAGKEYELELGRGGALEGQVCDGSGATIEGVVVALSRGDGLARSIRSDPEGRYRFELLTPGAWRVETRETEPSTEVFSLAQTEEDKQFDWNCEIEEGETTIRDLELRPTVVARVNGSFLVGGAPAAGWTAQLEVRGHDPRNAPALSAVLDATGGFELMVPSGRYDLLLQSPAGAPVALSVQRELRIEGELYSWSEDLATARLAGVLDAPGMRVRLVRGRSAEEDHEVAVFAADAEGRFDVAGLPSGSVTLLTRQVGELDRGWESPRPLELSAGRRTELE